MRRPLDEFWREYLIEWAIYLVECLLGGMVATLGEKIGARLFKRWRQRRAAKRAEREAEDAHQAGDDGETDPEG